MPSGHDHLIDKLLVFIFISSGGICRAIIDNSVFFIIHLGNFWNLGKDEWFEKAFVIDAVGEPS